MADKIKLKEHEALYKSLFNNMPDGLAYCQVIFTGQRQPVDFIYVKVNKNFEKLTGLKNVEGKKVTELIPGINTSNPELLEIYGRVALGGKPERFETYVKPLERWFLVSVYSPKKEFFTAIFQNITSQKQVYKDLENSRIATQNVLGDLQVEKEKLAESEKNYRGLVDVMNEGLGVQDNKGIITFMNKAGCEMLGYKLEELVGKPVAFVFDKENQKIIQGQMAKRKKGERQSYEVEWLCKDGKNISTIIAPSPIFDKKGNLTGSVAVFTDISDRKKVEARLLEVDKVKSEFVSLASHELRTPLTAIDGIVSMILNGEYGEVNKELMQPLSDVNTSSERLIHLVNDLLNLSRLQAGKLKYTLSETDIKPIVEGVVKMLQIIAEPKGLKLSAPNIDSVTALADVNKMEQILDNLIGNSLKFTDKGSIVLSTKITEDNVVIFITDTGIGIGKEDLGKLFGKFEKLESGLGRPAGTGLGLHISREMARKMGGDVWLEKSEKGVGSTFAFSLPKSKTPLAEKIKKPVDLIIKN